MYIKSRRSLIKLHLELVELDLVHLFLQLTRWFEINWRAELDLVQPN